MSGWDSRIRIRIDQAVRFEDAVPTPTLDAGELAAAVSGIGVRVRIGQQDGQAFTEAPVMMAGEPGFVPLTVADGSAESGGDDGLLVWDGTKWEPGGTPIEFATDTASGVLTYTASTDTWDTDTTSFVPSSLDGGTFTGTFTAPSFASSYTPQIGNA